MIKLGPMCAVAAAPCHPSRAKILAVEDDESDFMFLRMTLERNPAVALFRVEDGEKAFQFLTGKGAYSDRAAYPLPDVMLLDLDLPGMSGFQLLDRLRKLKREIGCNIYILSGTESAESRQKSALLGADGYFLKPLSLGHLAEIFSRLRATTSRTPRYSGHSEVRALKLSLDDEDSAQAELSRTIALPE